MGRRMVGDEKYLVLTLKQFERFTAEWDAARRMVLKGLWRRKEVRDGQSSGKTYGHR